MSTTFKGSRSSPQSVFRMPHKRLMHRTFAMTDPLMPFSRHHPPLCRLLTLGCKVNQYETQYVKEALEANGYREAGDGAPADLCIVNTCTVTHEGDAKS